MMAPLAQSIITSHLRVMGRQFEYTAALAIIVTFFLLSQLSWSKALLIGGSGVLSWLLTVRLIPKVRQFMLAKGISGLDINKKGSSAGQKPIPECIGFASAVSFCMVALLLAPLLKLTASFAQLNNHLAVLVTVLGTILLGFADDILDLQWRYKLLFPFFIILPFVAIYSGPTHFQVIYPISLIFGDIFQLGYLYLLYITCLGIYKTNTINIFAGINGLEVGQSIIAASSMLLYFGAESLIKGEGEGTGSQSAYGSSDGTASYGSQQYSDSYHYSAYLLVSFLGGALALMKLNQFPSQIFIGDTFCYYSGIVLAIAAILGGIPVVCHWFFIPQLINFLYSIPQLTGKVPCPRHRLAEYHPSTDTLHAIPSNMNMLNLSLRVLGPTHQGTLCLKLLLFQGCFSLVPLAHLLLTAFSK